MSDTYIIFRGRQYTIPQEEENRFLYLTRKILHAESDPDYIELLRGTTILFDHEFKKYESKH